MPNVATLLDAVALAPVDYRVEVKTSDRFQAGTSARVFCNLFGVQGSTGRWAASPGGQVGGSELEGRWAGWGAAAAMAL